MPEILLADIFSTTSRYASFNGGSGNFYIGGSPTVMGAIIETGSTSGSYQRIEHPALASGKGNLTDTWRNKFSTSLGTNLASSGGKGFVGCGFVGVDGSGLTLTHDHMGVIIDEATNKIYATNADGTTQTQTDTGLSWNYNTQWNITIENDGSEINFYINGVLEATHTTNLPDSVLRRPFFACVTNEDTTNGIRIAIQHWSYRMENLNA